MHRTNHVRGIVLALVAAAIFAVLLAGLSVYSAVRGFDVRDTGRARDGAHLRGNAPP
jgi:hypothetical protein